MSELYTTADVTTNIRKTLLVTASALVLAGYGIQAQASGTNRPTVWIEGGWHFESVTGDNDPFLPPLDADTRAIGFTPFSTVQEALGRTYGAEGSISFQPNGSDWVFSISARYGRVQTARNILDQKDVIGPQLLKGGSNGFGGAVPVVPYTPSYGAFERLHAKNSEGHVVVDFQVGKDIGVGLFGRGTDSIVNFGIRYAQMNAKSKGDSYGIPYVRFEQGTRITHYKYLKQYGVARTIHQSSASMERWDNFQALGPSLSLKNTTGLLGTVDNGQIALDWGVNAALLFGRQKAKASHHSTTSFYNERQPVTRTRSRRVIVPNIGGFAGLSYRFPNAKISAGYRADFFFGAKDGGLETRNTVDVGFHGPYATISIGLGG